jgi:hypothetical protein
MSKLQHSRGLVTVETLHLPPSPSSQSILPLPTPGELKFLDTIATISELPPLLYLCELSIQYDGQHHTNNDLPGPQSQFNRFDLFPVIHSN